MPDDAKRQDKSDRQPIHPGFATFIAVLGGIIMALPATTIVEFIKYSPSRPPGYYETKLWLLTALSLFGFCLIVGGVSGIFRGSKRFPD